MRTTNEVNHMFDRLDSLFDAQCRALEDQLPDLDAASLVEAKKLEMDIDIGLATPSASKLSKVASQWYDGYRYGLLRGYWRALCWVVYENDEDLLNEKD